MRPERAVSGNLAKEHERGVFPPERSALLRMVAHPAADRRHRQLLARDLAAVEQQPADRDIGLAVGAVVADPDGAAFLQLDLPRTLDFEKERGDRVVDPQQLQSLPGQRTIFDLGPTVARGIWRAAVDRGLERAAAMARAREGDLEITGEQALALAVVAGQIRREIGLEELPRRAIVPGRQLPGGRARPAPFRDPAEIGGLVAGFEDGLVGARQQGRARAQQGRDCSREAVFAPADQLIVTHRREGQPRRRLAAQQVNGDGDGDRGKPKPDPLSVPGASRHPGRSAAVGRHQEPVRISSRSPCRDRRRRCCRHARARR